jgi:transposase
MSVEATFVPGASIVRVAREHGVNTNQVFQWRHEYRKGFTVGTGAPYVPLVPRMAP